MSEQTTEHSIWQIWFDGSALPNPGKIGIGILILSPDGQRMEHAAAPNLHGCNNQAELHALITAFELASKLGARHLLVRGDSDVAIRHVRGEAITRIASLVPLIATARSWVERFERVELQWVPRHRNLDADCLCRQALGLAQKPEVKFRMKKRR